MVPACGATTSPFGDLTTSGIEVCSCCLDFPLREEDVGLGARRLPTS
jgi:hypothetical protein